MLSVYVSETRNPTPEEVPYTSDGVVEYPHCKCPDDQCVCENGPCGFGWLIPLEFCACHSNECSCLYYG